ncbi:MAG TPA: GFA family protein [Pararhizobium sp.]|uniref:GFA family protein n=1 Tax=Pararhizobium sp. TaxID=1977563 RepID=UPI002CC75412|nr:GFA family protein [Pararhizobium sp.]HTO34006.1 GFA family protein [Pararhizobium sp.]
MKMTYKGSCHCGKVRFEADIDLDAGTGKCNCSICTKRRAWNALIKPEDFRLLSSGDEMGEYQFGTMSGHYHFCRTCGIMPFSDGYIEQIGGAFVSVSLACLDDLDPSVLAEAPVSYADGRNNAWWNTPAETRHL